MGATEAALAARGIQVTAVPLDSVIGTCAEGKGVEVVYEDADSLMMSLSGRQFDVILISNIPHLVPEPDVFWHGCADFFRRMERWLPHYQIFAGQLPCCDS